MLEDIAQEFQISSKQVIQFIQQLVDSGDLTGVIDDRGKFLYLSEDLLKQVIWCYSYHSGMINVSRQRVLSRELAIQASPVLLRFSLKPS